jgi:glycosyltransferase involved in cell wall biosynthesis
VNQNIQSNNPLVSILLPTHNRADVLPFAIHSVLAQTIQDFELLIVGDGCTDNTAEVVKSFTDSRIQWFDLPKAPNFGYANRNVALKSARGSYIAFMAHDDLWLSDHLEILSRAFKDDKVEIAYSRPLWVIPRGLIVPGTFNLNFYPVLEKFLSRERSEIPASCIMHREECFQKYG